MRVASHRRAALLLVLGGLLVVGGFHLSACAGKDGGGSGSAEKASASGGTAKAPETATKTPVAADKFPYAEPAPAFELPSLSGSKVKLADFRGKVVLLDFWATWCGPCRMEIPHLKALHEEYGSQGFVVVGISVDQKGKSVVAPFVEKNKIGYPVLIADYPVVQAYGGIRSVPTAFLIDRDGLIRQQYVGYRPKEVFLKDLKLLLSGA